MKVAGVDFSSHAVDVVLLDEDGGLLPAHLRFPFENRRYAFERLLGCREVLPTPGWWADESVYLIALESPKSKGFGAAVDLARVQGAIIATLPRNIITWQLTPNEWKREIGFPGVAKKDAYRAKAIELGAMKNWTEHAIDAFCIAYAARAMNERGIAQVVVEG